MLTSVECRARATDKFAEAERQPRQKERLLTAAQGWLILAGIMVRLETGLSARPRDGALSGAPNDKGVWGARLRQMKQSQLLGKTRMV